jgi:cytochrome P450
MYMRLRRSKGRYASYSDPRSTVIVERAQAEVAAVLGDSPPGPAHRDDLHILERITREALRLYPPIRDARAVFDLPHAPRNCIGAAFAQVESAAVAAPAS